ncbi:hypothetical protein JCM21900_005596 [Sporobolomyces salmonicolor]
MTTSPANTIRTLSLSTRPDLAPVALARNDDAFALVMASQKDREEHTWLSTINVVADDDPYPGMTLDGKQMIWFKNYSENEGLLEQLEKARWVRAVGRELKQGFVTLPLAQVLLDESEIAQRCALCEVYESIETQERFKRCTGCKRRYYCSKHHQLEHWSRHKKDCKDLKRGDLTSVENRRRREQMDFTTSAGGGAP